MRADRLIALLLLLQTRQTLTAAEAAQELEVSERTARRDLEALAMSGVPVYSTAGRGGGWKLLGGARTDLTGLSATEARALFLAAGPALESTPELKSAMRKLSNALPETFRADAEAAASALKIDPNGWGQVGSSAPTHLDELTQAVVSGTRIVIGYESPRSGTSTREVSPLGLVTKRNVWYLVANTTSGMRTFRVARVKKVSALTSPVDRPEDFNLETEWDRIVEVVEAKRGGFVVKILAERAMLGPLRYQFSGRIDIEQNVADGRFAATITEFGPTPLAAQLVGYGNAIEILDPPPSLVAEIRRISQELHDEWLQ